MTPLVSFCFRAQCGWLLVTLASPNFDLRRLTVSLGSFWRERRFEIPPSGYAATGQMSPTIIEIRSGIASWMRVRTLVSKAKSCETRQPVLPGAGRHIKRAVIEFWSVLSGRMFSLVEQPGYCRNIAGNFLARRWSEVRQQNPYREGFSNPP
jgi:hypothetical protein